MGRFRVQVTDKAQLDLIEIWRSIAEHSEIVATQFLQKLDRRIDSLAAFPDRGALREEFGKNVRILIEGKYLIFYRKSGKLVQVLRIISGAMDLSKLGLV